MKPEVQSDCSAINLKQISREHSVQDSIIIDSGKLKPEFKIQTKYLAISFTIICKKILNKFVTKHESKL